MRQQPDCCDDYRSTFHGNFSTPWLCDDSQAATTTVPWPCRPGDIWLVTPGRGDALWLYHSMRTRWQCDFVTPCLVTMCLNRADRVAPLWLTVDVGTQSRWCLQAVLDLAVSSCYAESRRCCRQPLDGLVTHFVLYRLSTTLELKSYVRLKLTSNQPKWRVWRMCDRYIVVPSHGLSQLVMRSFVWVTVTSVWYTWATTTRTWQSRVM